MVSPRVEAAVKALVGLGTNIELLISRTPKERFRPSKW